MTPEIAEHAEDLQAVETMTIHGVLGPGTVENSCSEACHFVFGGDVSLDTIGRLPMLSRASDICTADGLLSFHSLVYFCWYLDSLSSGQYIFGVESLGSKSKTGSSYNYSFFLLVELKKTIYSRGRFRNDWVLL